MQGFATSEFFDGPVNLADPSLYAEPQGDVDAVALLPRLAFRSAVFAAMEDERIWTPSWVCVGSEAEIMGRGDLLPYTVGSQAVHVQRDERGGLVARYNKAQHGGCRFVPLQCQTGTKTRCSFTSCGYSRDRMPIKGAVLTETSTETYQYLGLRPERLPAVPLALVGALLFVNLDPTWAGADAAASQPCVPIEWVPRQGVARLDGHWHECSANWKLLAPALLDGMPGDEAPDGSWIRSRTLREDGVPIELLWAFPNLVIWRSAQSICAIVLQPTAVGKTVCRLSVFANGRDAASTDAELGGWRARLVSQGALAERAQAACHSQSVSELEPEVSTCAAVPHLTAYCRRQVARHVLIGRPGYQPQTGCKSLVGV